MTYSRQRQPGRS